MIATTITVTTSPTLLVAATANATRTIYIEPVNGDIHVGGSNVTDATGLVSKLNTITAYILPPRNAMYAVTGSGSKTVRILVPEGDY